MDKAIFKELVVSVREEPRFLQITGGDQIIDALIQCLEKSEVNTVDDLADLFAEDRLVKQSGLQRNIPLIIRYILTASNRTATEQPATKLPAIPPRQAAAPSQSVLSQATTVLPTLVPAAVLPSTDASTVTVHEEEAPFTEVTTSASDALPPVMAAVSVSHFLYKFTISNVSGFGPYPEKARTAIRKMLNMCTGPHYGAIRTVTAKAGLSHTFTSTLDVHVARKDDSTIALREMLTACAQFQVPLILYGVTRETSKVISGAFALPTSGSRYALHADT